MWNYRVIEFVDPDREPWRAIHEVYYNDDGTPRSYGENPATVIEEDDEGYAMVWTLTRMGEALGKPTLTGLDFNTSGRMFDDES